MNPDVKSMNLFIQLFEKSCSEVKLRENYELTLICNYVKLPMKKKKINMNITQKYL